MKCWWINRSVHGSGPGLNYLTLSAVHRLFVELLPDEEADLRGADDGGGLDVEVLVVLFDLHAGFGRSHTGDPPQHHVHTWTTSTELPEGPEILSQAAEESSKCINWQTTDNVLLNLFVLRIE